MGHKTLIDGTAYEISGGKTLVGGTAYSIKNGKTLVDGTAHEVGFVSGIPITVKGWGGLAILGDPEAHVIIDGEKYSGVMTTHETKVYYVPFGTVITCTVGSRSRTKAATITLNGETVKSVICSDMLGISPTYTSYEYTVTAPVTIVLERPVDDEDKSYGALHIIE